MKNKQQISYTHYTENCNKKENKIKYKYREKFINQVNMFYKSININLKQIFLRNFLKKEQYLV